MARPSVSAVRAVAVAAAVLLTTGGVGGCGRSNEPAAPAPTEAASADSAPQAAAVTAAGEFLEALVAEDHDRAYGILSARAQAALPLDDFAAARRAKNSSARSLGQRYELGEPAGEPPSVTVQVTGRLADGTAVRLALPMVLVDGEWRVDEAPSAF